MTHTKASPYQAQHHQVLSKYQKRVKNFIHQQGDDGVTSVAEVARHTELYIKHQPLVDQPLPSRLNRRYFPTWRDLTNIIYQVHIALMHSTIDRQNLLEKIVLWSGGSDSFLFRLYSGQGQRHAVW